MSLILSSHTPAECKPGTLGRPAPQGLQKPDAPPQGRDQPLHQRGIIDPAGAARRIQLQRHPAEPWLSPFVEFLWCVQWDLSGQPAQSQRTLPFPHAHLVFDRGCTAVHGVLRRVFERQLQGRGRVLGLRFRVGGLRPLLQGPMSALTDRQVSTAALWGLPSAAAESAVLDAEEPAALCAHAQAFLQPLVRGAKLPEPLAAQAVAVAAADEGPCSVSALARALSMSERQLQRLFQEHVGVPPKWVVQRFRLQEAVHRLSSPEAVDLADLAQSLGFYDQAHFTREFSRLIGRSPASYRRTQTAAG